jgi:hypothetical protein
MPDIRSWRGVAYESLVSRLKVTRSSEFDVEICIGSDPMMQKYFTVGIGFLRPLADALNRVADEIAKTV